MRTLFVRAVMPWCRVASSIKTPHWAEENIDRGCHLYENSPLLCSVLNSADITRGLI